MDRSFYRQRHLGHEVGSTAKALISFVGNSRVVKTEFQQCWSDMIVFHNKLSELLKGLEKKIVFMEG